MLSTFSIRHYTVTAIRPPRSRRLAPKRNRKILLCRKRLLASCNISLTWMIPGRADHFIFGEEHTSEIGETRFRRLQLRQDVVAAGRQLLASVAKS